jgi:hypothetical protein
MVADEGHPIGWLHEGQADIWIAPKDEGSKSDLQRDEAGGMEGEEEGEEGACGGPKALSAGMTSTKWSRMRSGVQAMADRHATTEPLTDLGCL